ncbi:hypothetical protein [Pantoea vagans]|uniref:hypothetical protein n=1 Tax=Pantoea vagans TaxID=470934 RepID=UPI00320AEB44
MKKVEKCFLLFLVLPFFSHADADISAGFSPGGTAQALILNFIHTAAGSADVAAYDFTSAPVAEALSKLAQSGVRVRIVAKSRPLVTG